jgi:hypothetical protein
MKTKILSIAVLIVLLACERCPKEDVKTDEITKVENLLEKYVIAIENEDYLMIENLWDGGDSTMLLGTDSHERLMGWESIRNAYKNQFNLLSDTYISVQDQFIRINCSANTAWFSQRMNYNFIYDSIAHSFEGIRFTGVLVKNEDNVWKMVQGHLSVPAHINIGK